MVPEYLTRKFEEIYKEMQDLNRKYESGKSNKIREKYRREIDDKHDLCTSLAFRNNILNNMDNSLRESHLLWKKVMGLD